MNPATLFIAVSAPSRNNRPPSNEDPRKLTAETVEHLRAIVVDDRRDDAGFFDDELIEEHSDAISAYLPLARR